MESSERMEDFVGQTITPGDKVVWASAGKHPYMYTATITGLTPKMVHILLDHNPRYRPYRLVPADRLVKYGEA